MIRVVQISGILGMSIFLAGCGIGLGLFPKSSYETLHPKPYRDYWIKSGTTEEARRADWMACGGSENGNFSWDSRTMLPGETNETSRHRQSSELKACLTQRGYRYDESPRNQ